MALESIGTEGRNRTDTVSPPPDFESGASTSSATPALLVQYINLAIRITTQTAGWCWRRRPSGIGVYGRNVMMQLFSALSDWVRPERSTSAVPAAVSEWYTGARKWARQRTRDCCTSLLRLRRLHRRNRKQVFASPRHSRNTGICNAWQYCAVWSGLGSWQCA
jgi:hypothetical protein